MKKYKINKWWIIVIFILLTWVFTAEYFLNINKISNAGELPFVVILIDELYPLWGPMLIGILLGFVISIIPVKGLSYSKRMIRSFVLGTLICNILFASFYGYIAFKNGFKEYKITRTIKLRPVSLNK